MKYLILLLSISVVPFSLSAQTKPAYRKSNSTAVRQAPTRQAVVRTTTAPTNASASAGKSVATHAPATSSFVGSGATTVQPQPVPQSSPVKVQAQNPPISQLPPVRVKESRFKIGFRVGGNSSTMGGVDVTELGEGIKLARVTGLHGGIVFNFGGPTLSVQPEILFSQYGVRMTYGDDYLQIKYNLVEVPILLKASFGKPSLRFFVNGGPVATYAMSGTISVREGGESDSQRIDMTSQGQLAYGASGGAGVAFKAGMGTIMLEGRYSYLFSDGSNNSHVKPQNAMVSVGYLIPLGKR